MPTAANVFDKLKKPRPDMTLPRSLVLFLVARL